MTVTTPVQLPDSPSFRKTQISPRSVVGSNESAYSLSQQYHDFGGFRWHAVFTLPDMDRDQAEKWVTALTKIRGKKREFEAGPRHANEPRGTGGGSPVVDSVNSAKNRITSSGWNANEEVLLPGDWIEANGELKKCLDTVDSDSNGEATFDVEPEFRVDPSGNNIITSSPQTTWRLTENNPSWTVEIVIRRGIVLDAIESF